MHTHVDIIVITDYRAVFCDDFCGIVHRLFPIAKIMGHTSYIMVKLCDDDDAQNVLPDERI